MAEPFLAEIKMFSFDFAPRGWAVCDGSILPINRNQALFSLIGNYYGGDGVTNFALPDLRGRVPVHFGNGVALAQKGGEETHTLAINEMPQHNHLAMGSNVAADTKIAAGNVWAQTTSNAYSSTENAVMSSVALTTSGGDAPHSNMQPYTVMNYCIAISGIFPSRT